VIEKIAEELREVEDALAGGPREAVEDEIGDLLFAVANLARHAGVDGEAALRRANAKFERRFGAIETGLASAGRTPEQATLEEMEELWLQAKCAERKPGG
jgi:ATP diphosphatase